MEQRFGVQAGTVSGTVLQPAGGNGSWACNLSTKGGAQNIKSPSRMRIHCGYHLLHPSVNSPSKDNQM